MVTEDEAKLYLIAKGECRIEKNHAREGNSSPSHGSSMQIALVGKR